ARQLVQRDRLRGLARAEQQAGEDPGEPGTARQPGQAAGPYRDEGERRDGVALGEQVGDGHAVDEILRQRERRPPCGADEDEESGPEQRTRGGWRCHGGRMTFTVCNGSLTLRTPVWSS